MAFGEPTMNRTKVGLWYSRFLTGRPSTSNVKENIEAVKKMISDNCRITIRKLGDDVGISFGSRQAIFMNV